MSDVARKESLAEQMPDQQSVAMEQDIAAVGSDAMVAAEKLYAAKLTERLRREYGVDRPRATGERLQWELLALTIFANAAYVAQQKQEEGEKILMGYDWEPLAAAVLPRIAKLADRMTFAITALPQGDEGDQDDDRPAQRRA